MSSFYALMKHAIDYAGLYPPASLALTTTLNNYAAYRESELGWATWTPDSAGGRTGGV